MLRVAASAKHDLNNFNTVAENHCYTSAHPADAAGALVVLMGGASGPQKVDFSWIQRILVASLLLVAMPFVPSCFLLLVVRPGATSSVLVRDIL